MHGLLAGARHMTMCGHTSSRDNSASVLLGALKKSSVVCLYIGANVRIQGSENENGFETYPLGS